GIAALTDLHVGSNGTITAAGYKSGAEGRVVIARFSATGVLDGTYGDGGVASFPGADAFNGGMVVLDDGSVVASGTVGNNPLDYKMSVARLTPTGLLDPGFGDGGVVVHTPEAFERGGDLVVRRDGSIVVATTGGFTLIAYDAKGQPDGT